MPDQRPPDAVSWFDEPMRWLHLNLVEDDPLRADVAFWSRYWSDAHVDGVTISAAGAAAYYPTAIPDHPRAIHADGRDLFGELVAAAKELDLRVLARFEPTNVSAEQIGSHPDWVARDSGGKPRHTSDPMSVGIRDNLADALAFASLAGGDRFAPCINGPYFRDFIPEVMAELASNYPIDGYYANGWPRLSAGPPQEGSICHCASCQSAWRSRGAGHDSFPDVADPDDPLWRDYVTFVQENVEDVQASWQAHARSLRPGLTFVCNLFGSLANGLRWDRFRRLVDVFVHDGQGRSPIGPSTEGPANHALWAAGRGAQVLRAAIGADRQMFHAVGAWHTGPPALRRVGKEPAELTQMLAQVVAHGARPYCNVAGAVVHDRRWMTPLGEYYRWHATNERYLRAGRSLADVGVLWTAQSNWTSWSTRRRVRTGPSASDAFNGWHLAMLEARVPYDVIPGFDLGAVDLHRYRALVVPSGTILDDIDAGILADFGNDAGGLIIGCGALPAGDKPGDQALRSAMGLTRSTTAQGPARSAYLAVSPADLADPLLAGTGDTDFLGAGFWTAPAEVDGPTTVGVATHRPPLPFLADRAFWTEPADERPVLTHAYNRVYLGTDLDALYGCTLMPDAGRVLTNALMLALSGRHAACTVAGAGSIDVHPWHVGDAVVVHLVNHTNDRLYGGPLTSITAVGPQAVRLRVPDETSVRSARLLRAGTPATWRQDGDEIEVDIDAIEDFEVLAVDLDTAGRG